MKVFLVWVREPTSPAIEDVPYVVEAWDEYAVDENEAGWAEALKAAQAKYGGENVRVMTVSIPTAATWKLWDAPVVPAKVVNSNEGDA